MKEKISWDSISLSDFIQIQSIATSNLDDMTKTVELLKVITHNEQIDDLPINEFKEQTVKLKLLEMPLKHNKIRKEYILNGKRYITTTKIKELTTGQYIDYCNLCKNPVGIDSIKKIVAILLIPEGTTYCNGYDLEDVESAVENYMSITDIYGVADFFRNALQKYSKALVDYLRKEILRSELDLKTKVKVGIALVGMKRYMLDLLNTD